MPRLPPIALAALATVAAVLAGLPLRRTVLERTEALEPGTEIVGLGPLVALLPALLAVALVGRLVLSLLPPGNPGSHRPRELAATWAASHLLGSVALGAQLEWARLLDLGQPGALVLLAPWAVLEAGRLVTLPGALVPRHEPPRERPDSLSRAALLGLVPMALAPLFLVASTPSADVLAAAGEAGLPRPYAACMSLGSESVLSAAYLPASDWIALLVLSCTALTTARRAPSGRRAVVLLLALTPAAVLAAGAPDSRMAATLAFGAGCAFLVPWLRRADRRGAALAAIAFLACTLSTHAGPRLAAVGVLALLLLTRGRRARRKLAGLVTALLVAIALPLLAQAWRTRVPDGAEGAAAVLRAAAERSSWGVHWPLAATALVWGAVGLARRGGPEAGGEPVDPPRPELAGVGAVLLGVLLVEVLLAAFVGAARPEAGAPALLAPLEPDGLLLLLAPAAALVAGLSLVRPERP